MDREQALAYARKYQLVNQITRQEIQEMPVEEKLRQLAIMVSACQILGWTDRMEADEEKVRQRWLRLKKKDV